MVHALEITHGLLKKDGRYIDIHPNGEERPLVEVRLDGVARPAGHLDETDDFVEYFEADDALAEVTARGLFELERQGLFTFLLHAPTIEALTGYLEDEWSDAVLPEEVMARLKALMAEPAGEKEIVVYESVRIARYRPGG